MISRRRNSLRLKGYDYSDPGIYFVTIRSARMRCIFGKVIDGRMEFSSIGAIADSCWREIPEHFSHARVDTYQIMPNHVHGIIDIRDSVRAQHAAPVQMTREAMRAKPLPHSLSAIVRSFKSAVTNKVHAGGVMRHSVWHRSFHDRIIRDDVSFFFIRQYIELNPLLWHVDSDCPEIREIPVGQLRDVLRGKFGLDGLGLQIIVDHELSYRNWDSEKEATAPRPSG